MPTNRTEQALARLSDLTPRKIVAELDRYIIGQADAKKAVAIALRNRWRRQRAPEGIREEIAPNNIILIGPTGVGKTEIARRLAKLAGAPFIKVEASKFTEVGYVGRDVEGMVRDLVESAIDLVRTEREQEVEDLAQDRVEERLLDLLLPVPAELAAADASGPKPGDAAAAPAGGGERVFVASPSGNVTAEHDAARERHKRTRDKLRQLLRDGQLEQREIEIEVTQRAMPQLDVAGQPGAPDPMSNLGEMLSELLPRRKKKRTVTVAEARRILLDEEFDKLVNHDEVVTDALERVEKLGIIFLDEIDKIAGAKGEMGGPDVSREG
ncbi:MAG: AAA family ATPase, partial [Gemmatimonadota bacterium]|nr:AAA family ATPase [Gemmatimonadota bacterium]